MPSENPWRERYLKLAEQGEAEEKRNQEAQRELLRLLSRLCVATAGLDVALDPHLKRLREAARGGASGKLISQAQDLGDALLKAQDQRVQGDLLIRLLDHSRLPEKRAKSAVRLWRNLAQAPARASDRQLDELAGLLFAGDAPGDAAQGGKGGLLGRLLRGSAREDPNELLLEVIASITWPEGARERVTKLQASLRDAPSDDTWLDVVREIGDMAASVLQSAHRDAEASSAFLAQLTQRLESLDNFISQDDQRRNASHDSGVRLGQAVTAEVDGLSASMQGAEGLPELRRQVLEALDRIQRDVSSHLEGENQRSAQGRQQSDSMRSQLAALEEETFRLRRQVEESRREAMRDALTGLPNRRALEARVSEELARLRRFGTPLALVVFDVDDFKQINDVFGHKAGDRALALIARLLTEDLRENDFIARYGGEELVGLISGVDADAALKLADSMRGRIEGAGMHSHNKPVRITVSGGVTAARGGDTFGQLFERADQAMYQAKRQGKNRCILAN